MTERELIIQAYLAAAYVSEKECQFALRCITSTIANAKALREQRINTIGRFQLTPQEELFAKYYNHEGPIVIEMDELTLIAHREELASVAHEARARLTRTDDEIRTRKAKKNAKGFIANVNIDDNATTSDAINKIKKRGEKISKIDKLVENMMKLPGMDRDTAEKIVMAGTLKTQLDTKFGVRAEQDKIEKAKAGYVEPVKVPVFNPFAATKNESAITAEQTKEIEVSIQEETNTIIIREAAAPPTVEESKEKPKVFNPFAK